MYEQASQKLATDLWLLSLSGDRKLVPYLQTPFDEMAARFSPDGRWMAYQSNESGRFQVYVQTVPSGAKYQISTSGGTFPRWRRDGKELFYIGGGRIMAASIRTSPGGIEVETPRPLFAISPIGSFFGYGYDVMPDGKRFLIIEPTSDDADPLKVVSDWQSGIRK